jgi:hypothetical protein
VHWHPSHRTWHRSAVHRHSGNRTWRESAAHSHPGHRITVPPHLRPRSRGCENGCYHATKENEFSPVHSVIGFKKLNPPGFEKYHRSRIGGNAVVTFGAAFSGANVNAPLNSPACSSVSITLSAESKTRIKALYDRLRCCAYPIAFTTAFARSYQSRPKGSASEIRSTPRLSLRGHISYVGIFCVTKWRIQG